MALITSDSDEQRTILREIITYNIMNAVGLALLTIIVVTAWLSPTIHRIPTWFMLLFSFIVSCIGNLLIVGHQMGNQPPWKLCLLQAATTYSAPVLFSSYATMFVVETYVITLRSRNTVPKIHAMVFHILPAIGFVGVFLLNLILGNTKGAPPSRLKPTGIYCHFSNPLPRKITAGITMLCMSLCLVLEALLYRRLWQLSRTIGGLAALRQRITLDAFIRAVILSVWPLFALIFSVLQFRLASGNNRLKESTDLLSILSWLPLTMALCFGSQKDMIRLCLFWRKNKPPTVQNFDTNDRSSV
ncbi:hypothetical protein CPC08DRAFT_702702 [Agrocybe pediades]|nr:hypothetical protein CPC08DRAFT_702702 [Agrocybe pediades]